MAAPKKYYEIAQTISIISVTILQIICWWGLIFDGWKDDQCISVYILKREPERIMTTVATLLPENFTIPPLIAMISINVCLISCIKMKRFSWDYCRWIESKKGRFLHFLDNCGLTVCYYNSIKCTKVCHCVTPRPLPGQFLYDDRGQKQTFFDPLILST